MSRRRRPALRSLVVRTLVVVVALGVSTAAVASCADTPARAAAPGKVDIGFSQAMVVHHQQAVEMATTVRGRVSPAIDQLAASIETTQLLEMGRMQGWLMLWGSPQVPGSDPMAWMRGSAGGTMAGHDMEGSGTAGADMPGMATTAQVSELSQDSGNALDVLFLQLMIRHHQGGVVMAQDATTHASQRTVRSTAAVMVAEQQQELSTMAAMLQQRGGTPLPAPGT